MAVPAIIEPLCSPTLTVRGHAKMIGGSGIGCKPLDFDTEPFYLPIIPIIFKSKENLDNNYKKTIKNGPFIGYSETSDLIICGPLIEIHSLGPF
jgi:hypothetical protein